MCMFALHVSIIMQWGDSALMEAARWGETKAVVELIKAGADLNLQTSVCQYVV